MPGRELYEFRRELVAPGLEDVYDGFVVRYHNPHTPDLTLPGGTVAAAQALLDLKQVKQLWAIKDGYHYQVA